MISISISILFNIYINHLHKIFFIVQDIEYQTDNLCFYAVEMLANWLKVITIKSLIIIPVDLFILVLVKSLQFPILRFDKSVPLRPIGMFASESSVLVRLTLIECYCLVQICQLVYENSYFLWNRQEILQSEL